MYELSDEFRAVRAGALTAALLALAEHIALWPYRDRLPLAARYTLGVAAIGAGVTVSAARRKRWSGVISFWCCAGASGAAVVALHFWRSLRGESAWPGHLFEAGRVAGKAEARRYGPPRER